MKDRDKLDEQDEAIAEEKEFQGWRRDKLKEKIENIILSYKPDAVYWRGQIAERILELIENDQK
jgi:hypothetical protein